MIDNSVPRPSYMLRQVQVPLNNTLFLQLKYCLFLGKRTCRVEILKNSYVAGVDRQRQHSSRAFKPFVLCFELSVLYLLSLQ